MMNLAGKVLAAISLVLCSLSLQSAAVVPTPLPQTSQTRESTLTLAQIVSGQRQHWEQLRSVYGQVEWQQVSFNKAQNLPLDDRKRTIFFASEGTRSLTMVMRSSAVDGYVSDQGKIPWLEVLSANLIADDVVYMISLDDNTSKPVITKVPFNPAVHENNPIVAFHPRQIGEERLSLENLLEMSGSMAARPVISEGMFGGVFLVRIQFINPELPDERLVYLVDPAKGFLPVQITRTSGDRLISLTSIIIGRAGGKLEIPARKFRTVYNTTGKVDRIESWHYSDITVNEPIPPRQLSLTYFYLAEDTPIIEAGNRKRMPLATSRTEATTQGPLGQGTPISRPKPKPDAVPRAIY